MTIAATEANFPLINWKLFDRHVHLTRALVLRIVSEYPPPNRPK